MTASLDFSKLTLTNFKNYRGAHELRLDLAPGLYYVRGVNEASPELDSNETGKTTLWDGVIWAIYNKTLRDERPGASVDPWTGEKGTKVALEFKRAGKQYTIVRGRHPNILTLNSAIVDQTAIQQAIGLSYAAFLCTIVLPQTGIRFLDLRPEEQSELFVEALDLDLWIRASDQASALVKDTQAEIDCVGYRVAAAEGRREVLAEQKTRALTLSREYVAERARQRASVGRELAQLRRDLATAEAWTPPINAPTDDAIKGVGDAIRTFRGRLDQARADIAEAQAIIDQFDADISRLETEIAVYRKRPQRCPECGHAVPAGHFDAKIKAKQAEADELSYERARAVLIQGQARKEAENAVETIEQRETALAHARTFMQQIEQDRAANDASRKILADKIKRLEADQATVKSTPDPHKATIFDIDEKLSALDGQLATDRAQLAACEAEKQQYVFWTESYRQIRLDMIDDLLRGLEYTANEQAQALGLSGWRLEFATEKETAAGKISRKLQTMIYPPGHATPIKWESFCGVQIQIWQLAVRFALAELFLAQAGLDTNIEILDEPTQHLSPGVTASLVQSLHERAARLGRVIYLVEHHTFDLSEFAGIITVLHDSDGSSISSSTA